MGAGKMEPGGHVKRCNPSQSDRKRLEKGPTVLLTLGESSPDACAYRPATSGPRSRQKGGGRRVVRVNRVVPKALMRRQNLYQDLEQVKGRALEI